MATSQPIARRAELVFDRLLVRRWPRWFDTFDVMEATLVDKWAITKAFRDGELPGVRDGQQWVSSRREILATLDPRRTA